MLVWVHVGVDWRRHTGRAGRAILRPPGLQARPTTSPSFYLFLPTAPSSFCLKASVHSVWLPREQVDPGSTSLHCFVFLADIFSWLIETISSQVFIVSLYQGVSIKSIQVMPFFVSAQSVNNFTTLTSFTTATWFTSFALIIRIKIWTACLFGWRQIYLSGKEKTAHWPWKQWPGSPAWCCQR